MDIKPLIRTIPDHPKPGIQFRDITTLLLDPAGVRSAVAQLAEPFGGDQIQKVAGVEARGFILAGSVARELGARLYGVRLDTAENVVDKALTSQMGWFTPTGVNPQLVYKVREALDKEGFQGVKIVVSGGFTAEKIRAFEEEGVPVDAYGVGASLFQGRFEFTADVVMTEGRPCAKFGREYRPNRRLEKVD